MVLGGYRKGVKKGQKPGKSVVICKPLPFFGAFSFETPVKMGKNQERAWGYVNRCHFSELCQF